MLSAPIKPHALKIGTESRKKMLHVPRHNQHPSGPIFDRRPPAPLIGVVFNCLQLTSTLQPPHLTFGGGGGEGGGLARLHGMRASPGCSWTGEGDAAVFLVAGWACPPAAEQGRRVIINKVKGAFCLRPSSSRSGRRWSITLYAHGRSEGWATHGGAGCGSADSVLVAPHACRPRLALRPGG
jgi:hypothetical protein